MFNQTQSRQSCLHSEEFAKLLNIALESSVEEDYLDHLSQCEECSSKLREIDHESDSLGELLTKCYGSDPIEDPRNDPHCQKMVDQIHVLGNSIKSEADFPLPKTIRDYQIGKKIGQGGMGLVYEAEHIHLKKKVAIKILSPERVPNQRFVNRFKREMTAIGKLDHPNIVRATDAGLEAKHHYLVMEYVDGLSLSQLVHRQGLQPVDKACQIIVQAAHGLQHAWDHSLVHRDIKPNNLMLSKNNETKILDLGLALLYEEEAESISIHGQIMGTADYMAPEQWESSHSVDIRADIYSLGCTLFFLLAGYAPYKSFSRKMRAHLNEPFPSIREIRKDVPEELGHVIEKMTAKDACDRYATPNDLIQALRPFTTDGSRLPFFVNPFNPVDENLTTQSEIVRSQGCKNTDRHQHDVTLPLVAVGAIGKKRNRKLTWILPLGILFSGIILLAAIYWPPSPKKPPQIPNTFGDSNYPKGVWHDTLAQTPLEFRWGNRDKIWGWTYDPEKRRVSNHIERMAVLSLGQVKQPSFTLRVQLQQFASSGNFGIFLGGQIDQNQEEVSFTRIEIYQHPDSREWFLKMGKTRLSQIDQLGDFHRIDDVEQSIQPIRTAIVPQPYILEIQVRDARIKSVYWDGHHYPGLIDSAIAFPENYDGEFGLFCRNTAVELTSAFFITH